MRKLVLAAAALLCACRSDAQPQQPLAPGAPKLLVVISVDQFSADLFDEYHGQFRGGFERLASGTVFRNGYQSHAATETCPGHSTILTGDRPARTGIIGNSWVDQSVARSDKEVYCAEDERVPGTSSTHYTVSPFHLRVPTLGELLKQRSPASLNVAVAGKDRAAVMMSGRRVDQRWYWNNNAFMTDTGAAAPKAVTAANSVVQRVVATPATPLDPPPFCAAKSQIIPIEGGGRSVGNGRFARAAGDATAFRASPEFDGAVLALAAALIQELRLGSDSATDILSINLAGTDYVGHTYGTGGQEMCLQLLSLDRDLGDFLARLDSWGIDYAVALTGDHGSPDIPERMRLHGVADAARADPALGSSKVGAAIAAKLKLKGPVLLGVFPGDLYIDKSLSSADRQRALAEAVAMYRGHPQVEAVFTNDEIARTPMPTSAPDRWSLLERLRASYDPERSGDLVAIAKRNVTAISDLSRYVAMHGSPWDYDRRVPIVFWRRNAAAAAHDEPVETVDIMPTLAAMIGVPLAAGSIDGKCLAAVAACPAAPASAAERGKR